VIGVTMIITKCLNEWNATVESLGQGKQTILIRNYGTNVPEFLLYPTVSYANKDNFLDSYKDDFKGFAEENSLPKVEGANKEVKYFAKVEENLEIFRRKFKKKFYKVENFNSRQYVRYNRAGG